MLYFASADWTAVLFRSCPVIQVRPPDVALGALPPDLFAGSWKYLIGGQIAVKCRVPLAGDGRVDGSEVVETFQQLSVGAVWTAARVFFVGTLCDRSGVFVTLVTDPPGFLSGIDRYHRRFKVTILCRMPLGGDVRSKCSEVVKTC